MIEKITETLSKTENTLYGKDFLLTWEKSDDELQLILTLAELMKEMRQRNISLKAFDSGLAVSMFRDKSTRTRFSFASACNLLGLAVHDLDEEKSQLSHGETTRETANMVSFLTDVVGIRDDMYLGEGNRFMREVAESLDEGFKEKVLPQRPGVINLQCDMDHPTQSMADLLHLISEYGTPDQLKGKKIAMTWAYSPSYGKPLSVPQGIIALMTRFGMDVHLAYPQGYDLIPEIVDLAGVNARKSGGSFTVSNSMEEAFRDADIVYPKSWAPYQVMVQRTSLLKNRDAAGLKELEKVCLENNARYMDWECNDEKMQLTRNGDALYMHCLPADISGVSCRQGEVQKEVFEKYRIKTYLEAGYKPYIIAAMIFANRFSNPAGILSTMIRQNQPRVSH
jgi:knotted carbamoyltransferase YgeW